MFEIRAFYWAGYFSGKAEEPLNQNKRFKISYGFGGHCNFSNLSGLYLYFESYKNALLWYLSWTSFPICFLLFTKICLVSSSYKYPPSWSFILTESNQFKVDITYKIGRLWIGDTWLTNLQKTAYAITLSTFLISNQVAKFNSWKLIVAR